MKLSDLLWKIRLTFFARAKTFFTTTVEKFESPISFFTMPETFFAKAVENFVVFHAKNAAYKTNFAKSHANFTKRHVNFAKGFAKNVKHYVNFVFEGTKKERCRRRQGRAELLRNLRKIHLL